MPETLSIKVSPHTKAELKAEARRRRTTPSHLLREAVEHVLSGRKSRPTCFDAAEDLLKNLDGGARDLSTHPRHLDEFGR
jgi:predicted DNA-binding protein